MGFLCCGSNSSVVEDTQQGAINKQQTPSEAAAAAASPAPVAPAPVVKTPSKAKTEPESPKKAEESTTTQSTTPAPVVEPVAPKKEEEVTKPVAPEPVPSKPVEPVQPEPAVKAVPSQPTPAAAPVETPAPAAPSSGPFLSSIIGSSIVKSGQSYKTDETLNSSAIVAIYYAPASLLVDQTKKLEVFAAGYEPKTLDIVYIAEDKDDTYVSSGAIPSTWYSVPKVSKSLKKTLKEKFAVSATPSLIVLHPGNEKVIDTSKSFDKILLLDPVAEDYDTKAYQIFQEWIKDLPMDQDLVGEVELEYEEPAVAEYTDDDDDDEESDSDDE